MRSITALTLIVATLVDTTPCQGEYNMIRKVLFILILILLMFSGFIFSNATHMSKMVSTDWLADNLNNHQLVLLHYGSEGQFKKEHIPGARHVSMKNLIVEGKNELKHELPDEGILQEVLNKWGINSDSIIVISYSGKNALIMLTRLYMTLDYAGLGDRTALLNGGLKRWKAEGRPVTDEIDTYPRGNYILNVSTQVIAQKNWINNNLNSKSVVIVDARPPSVYSGEFPDHNAPRKGHIQGAVNIPFNSVSSGEPGSLLKSEKQLRKLFEENYITGEVTIVVYCGSGVWAAPVWFAAKYLGYDARFYDGSYQEWGNDKQMPVTGPVQISE